MKLANKTLYVGNMSYDTTEEDLRALFEPHGPVAEVRIIGNKGFAFVEIPEENIASAIDAANGREFGGRTLTVNEARPRNADGGRSSGTGRGGFNGGRRRW
ncbi:MAG: RNA recognition motif domain-containing protein [Armatimonadota bacterium]